MTQITDGIRSVLSNPSVYDVTQRLLGAKKFRAFFAANKIRALSGDRILDIGCGTAEILDHLPDVFYNGYDISPEYIQSAKSRFGNRGQFEVKIITDEDVSRMKSFDLVLALGVLHHLDDESARGLIKTAYAALRPGGRFVTFDPVYETGQSQIARFLISKDRGQNVRDRAGYETLAKMSFEKFSISVRHQKWIPYSHCFIEATK